MCELYNFFLKSYNTVANIAAQLYIIVLEWIEDDKIGKEWLWKKDKQMSLIKNKPEENKKRDTEYFDDLTPSLNTE